MFKERILIIFLAIVLGLISSIGLFYLYQKTKVIPPQVSTSDKEQPSPETPSFFLNIESPNDEAVFDKKIVQLQGKTANDATVIISGEDRDLVVEPALDGSFSANITLLDGVNEIQVTAIKLFLGEKLTRKINLTHTTESL